MALETACFTYPSLGASTANLASPWDRVGAHYTDLDDRAEVRAEEESVFQFQAPTLSVDLPALSTAQSSDACTEKKPSFSDSLFSLALSPPLVAPSFLFRIDLHGNILSVGQSTARWLGYTSTEELKTKTVFDSLYFEDRNAFISAIRQLLTKDEVSLHYRRISMQKALWPVSSTLTAVRVDGQLSQVMLFERVPDETLLEWHKTMEQINSLTMLIEVQQDPVCLVNEDGMVVYASNVCRRAWAGFQLTTADENGSHSLSALVHQQDFETIQSLLRTGLNHFNLCCRVVTADRSFRVEEMAFSKCSNGLFTIISRFPAPSLPPSALTSEELSTSMHSDIHSSDAQSLRRGSAGAISASPPASRSSGRAKAIRKRFSSPPTESPPPTAIKPSLIPAPSVPSARRGPLPTECALPSPPTSPSDPCLTKQEACASPPDNGHSPAAAAVTSSLLPSPAPYAPPSPPDTSTFANKRAASKRCFTTPPHDFLPGHNDNHYSSDLPLHLDDPPSSVAASAASSLLQTGAKHSRVGAKRHLEDEEDSSASALDDLTSSLSMTSQQHATFRKQARLSGPSSWIAAIHASSSGILDDLFDTQALAIAGNDSTIASSGNHTSQAASVSAFSWSLPANLMDACGAPVTLI